MNQFITSIKQTSWFWPMTAMLVVTGLLLGGALSTQQRIQNLGLGSGRPTDQTTRTITNLQNEISALRKQQIEYVKASSDEEKQTKVIKEMLEDLQLKSGMMPVKGPGIEVVLRDSTRSLTIRNRPIPDQNLQDTLIHDFDVLRLVNELYAAGAEAISVNGHRLASGYSIRCVGPVIHVNNVPIGQPVLIQAIGDTEALKSAVELRGGVLDELMNYDPGMVEVNTKNLIVLKAYEGGTTTKFMKKAEGK